MNKRNVLIMIVAVFCAVLFSVLGLIIREQYNQIQKYKEKELAAEIIAAADNSEIEEGAENVKNKKYSELEKISANDLVNLYFTDTEYLEQTDFIDGILREQFKHFINILDEMELEIIRRPVGLIQ